MQNRTFNYQNSDKEKIKKMKLSVATIVAVASAQDNKKVPPRHPSQRLAKLNKFAREWCTDNLTEKQANNWIGKFDKNVERFERRFEQCGFYDDQQLPHGGPKPEDRKRREDDDDDILPRYNKENPVTGIKQITMGFKKWAERYVSTCKLQPERQVQRSNKWFEQLAAKYVANNA